MDSEAFLNHSHELGIAVCQDESAVVPNGLAPETFVRLSDVQLSAPPMLEDFTNLFGSVAGLVIEIMRALGIPREVLLRSDVELTEAALRSINLVDRRAEGQLPEP